MISVKCRTNMDGFDRLGWPDSMPVLPRVGERIMAKRITPNGTRPSLEVCQISYEYVDGNIWIPVIELTVPTGRKMDEFYKAHGIV